MRSLNSHSRFGSPRHPPRALGRRPRRLKARFPLDTPVEVESERAAVNVQVSCAYLMAGEE